jgi:transcriptional regulator with XRE-family HTH domain
MKIGEKIKKLREFRNLTQEHLAKTLDMTQAGYSRIERDEVDLNLNRLEQIAKVLNVSIEDILGFDANKLSFNTTANDQSIVYQNQAQGLADRERQHYESRITDLQKEIDYLRGMLEKNLLNLK